MTADNNASLRSVADNLNYGDPGDDVQLRFRYQNTYAGIISLMMLEDDTDWVEIFCEHHDDILVKFSDQKFRAIQVKTRDLNYRPFTIEDEAIIKSCTKFVNLEKAYPDQFSGYSIVSNNGFDKTNPKICLHELKKWIEKADLTEITKSKTKIAMFLKEFSKNCECTLDQVILVFKKLKLSSFCALEDIHMKLVNQIKSSKLLNGISESKIEELADLILAKFNKASSLGNEKAIDINYYILGTKNKDDLEAGIIESKKTSKVELIEWLKTHKEQPVTIKLKDRKKLADIPDGHRKMVVKMDEGNIDSQNIDIMKDLKYSFEQHALSWLHKDITLAEEKYSQLSILTENLCKEIYDELKIATSQDGQEMLVKVRKAIKERLQTDKEIFLDCDYEHLLGLVGVLTESCKIWWSHKFEIEV